MTLDINEIKKILPHRPPFLLVDRILEIEPNRIVGIKNVTMNEPFFAGHFPDDPVMPGVLIIEAMAQTGGVLAIQEKDRVKLFVLFASIEEARFRRPVVPGDQLRLELEVLSRKSGFYRMKGQAFVDGQLAADAILVCKVGEKSR